MSRVKEPTYFSRVPPGGIVRPVQDEATYLRLFQGAGAVRYRGEATPSYLGDPDAPGAIASVSPHARIVVSLREPLARARSAYWHSVRYGHERRTFREAIEDSLAKMNAAVRPRYLPRGLYADGVERYLRAFPGNVHVLFYEELAADTRLEVRRLYEFLGVDPAYADRIDAEVRNPTGLPRNAIVRRLYASRAARGLGLRLVPAHVHARLEAALLARADAVELDPGLRSKLLELYEPDRERLETLLGRSVPWRSE